MSKLKAFAYVYWKSISSISYYSEILKAKTSFSIKYFAIFATIMAVVGTILTSLLYVPGIQTEINNFMDSAKNYYPTDLVFEAKNDTWTVNRPEPFIVAVPENILKEAEQSKEKDTTEQMPLPKNFIVFDHNGTIDDFNKLDTLMLVNTTNVLVKDDNGFKAYPIEKLPNGKLDKALFVQNVDKLTPIVKAIPFLAIVFILFYEVIRYFIMGAIYLASTSAILWLAGKFTKIKPNFGEVSRITIHTATISFTLEIILGALNIEVPVQFWFTWINMIFALFVMSKIQRDPSQKVIIPQVIK